MKLKWNNSVTICTIIASIVLMFALAFNIVSTNSSKVALSPEEQRTMEYDVFSETDGLVENCENIRFNAFFAKDIDGDGNAERLNGTCKNIEGSDDLYMDFAVLSQGYLKDGQITINESNMEFKATLLSDKIIDGEYIGHTTSIKLQSPIYSGNEKLITGKIYSDIGSNINDYSSINSITLTGTYVDDEGNETKINKTVDLTVDWYGTTTTQVNINSQTGVSFTSQDKDLSSAITEDGFNVTFTAAVSETNEELMLQKQLAILSIPDLNGYDPISVSVYNYSNYEYDEGTQTLTITREAQVDENGNLTSEIARANQYRVTVIYPIEAYESMGADTVNMSIDIVGESYGYNNQAAEFAHPDNGIYKSTASGTIALRFSRPTGDVWNLDVLVGDYKYNTINNSYQYCVSKELPQDIYNGNENDENDEYLVQWIATINQKESIAGLVLQEQFDSENRVLLSDTFEGKQSSDKTSMYSYEKTTGIYFENAYMFGDNGWIRVYDFETGDLIAEFTKDTWDNYTREKPYKITAKSIIVKTSEVASSGSFIVNQVKEINDTKLTTDMTEEEFGELSRIYTYLTGTVYAKDGYTYEGGNTSISINKNNNAVYNLPYSVAEIEVTPKAITNQETKDVTVTIKTEVNSSYEEKWKNGVFLVELPDSIIQANIKNISVSDSNVILSSYYIYEENGKYFLKVFTKNDEETTYNIKVDLSVSAYPLGASKLGTFRLYAYNEYADNYYKKTADIYDTDSDSLITDNIGYDTDSISIIAQTGLLSSEYITNYDNNESVTVAPNVADIEKSDEARTATINVYVKNNYQNKVSDIDIIGKIPFEDNTYVQTSAALNSEFTAKIVRKLDIPDSVKDYVKIYYSYSENAIADLTDADSDWLAEDEVDDWSKVRMYYIDLGDYELSYKEELVFTYDVEVPPGLGYNTVSYSCHAIYYSLNTVNGKIQTSTEPNKVGMKVASKYNLDLQKTKLGNSSVLVSGATYKVDYVDEDGNTISKVATTDADGKLIFKDLYINQEYTLQEVSCTADYVLSTEKIKFTATLDEDENLIFDVLEGSFSETPVVSIDGKGNYQVDAKVQDEAKYTLNITKKDENGNILKDISFAVNGKGYSQKKFKTDENGNIKIKNLELNEEYTIKETKADGYYLDATARSFRVVKDDEGNLKVESDFDEFKNATISEIDGEIQTNVNIEIENLKIKKCNLKVIKVEEDDSIEEVNDMTKLQGAEFFAAYTDTGLSDTKTTDENGEFTIEGIITYLEGKGYTGQISLQEIAAPSGYCGDNESISITLTKTMDDELSITVNNPDELDTVKATYVEGDTAVIVIQDQPIFKIHKIDSETGESLANAQFTIREVDDDNNIVDYAKDVNGEYVGTKNSDGVYVLTTDSNGDIFVALRDGRYVLEEVSAPAKYQQQSIYETFQVGGTKNEDVDTTQEEIVPLEIDSIEDLLDFKLSVDNGNTYQNQTVLLMKDLDFKDESCYEDASSTEYGDLNGDGTVDTLINELTNTTKIYQFTIGIPKGTTYPVFEGTFKGNNQVYTISNWQSKCYGLFDMIDGATIENIGISGTITDEGSRYIGGLVGSAYNASIKNCYSNVKFESVSQNYYSRYIGGLVGYVNNSTVDNCYNVSDISIESECSSSSEDPYALGGVVGFAKDSTISKLYNNGNLSIAASAGSNTSEWNTVGGVIGTLYRGSLTDAYNTGNLDMTGKVSIYEGGVVGYGILAPEITSAYNIGIISESATGKKYVDGIVGDSEEQNWYWYYYAFPEYKLYPVETNTFCSTDAYSDTSSKYVAPSYLQEEDVVDLLNSGRSVWQYNEGDYPTFASESAETEEHEYITEIYTVEDLVKFEEDVNNGYDYNNISVRLMNTIDFADINCYDESDPDREDLMNELLNGNGFTPIGSKTIFRGTFDGLNNTIKNFRMVINDSGLNPNYFGLFAQTSNATIKRLGLTGNVEILETRGIDSACGALIGNANSTEISNCWTDVNISDSNYQDDHEKIHKIIVGTIAGKTTNCTVSKCYNTGNIDLTHQGEYIGGLIGYDSHSNISESYNLGDIYTYYGVAGGLFGDPYDTVAKNIYNAGNVTGGDSCSNVGGIMGYSNAEKISYAYNIGKVYTANSSGSVNQAVGKNTQMNVSEVYYLDTVAEEYTGTINEEMATSVTSSELNSDEIYTAINADKVWIKTANYPRLFATGEFDVATSFTIENTIKKYKITTDVRRHGDANADDHTSEGTISGEDLKPYETVNIGKKNTQEIQMIPAEGYEIYSVTINGKEISVTANSDGSYTIPASYFTMYEDKHIVVEYKKGIGTLKIRKVKSTSPTSGVSGATFEMKRILEDEIGELQSVGTPPDGCKFVYEDGVYYIVNENDAYGYTVEEYFELDLTDCEDCTFSANVDVSTSTPSEIAITESTDAVGINNNSLYFKYSYNAVGDVVTTTLEGGKKYYVHLCHMTTSVTDTYTETFKVYNVKVTENYTGKSNYLGYINKTVKAGKYEIKETEAPKGYYLNKNTYTLDVKLNEENLITIADEQIPSTKVVVSKRDSDSRELLSGAEFKMYENITAQIPVESCDEYTDEYVDPDEKTIFVNNISSKGYGEWNEGTIVLDLTDKTGYCEISANVTSTASYPVWMYVTDNEDAVGIKSGSMNTNRTDTNFIYYGYSGFNNEDFSTKVECGKKYYLKLGRMNGSSNEKVVINSLKFNIVKTFTTGTSGKVSQVLYPGIYRIEEIKAPKGYYLDMYSKRTHFIEFTISNDGSLTYTNGNCVNSGSNSSGYTIDFYNDKIPDYVIVKEDSEDSTIRLSGAKFLVTKEITNDVIGNLSNSTNTPETSNGYTTDKFVSCGLSYEPISNEDYHVYEGYVPLDLTDYKGTSTVTFNMSYFSYSPSWIFITDSTEFVGWEASYNGRTDINTVFWNTGGNADNTEVSATLEGGKKYYIHMGYSVCPYVQKISYFKVNSVKVTTQEEVVTDQNGWAEGFLGYGDISVQEIEAPEGYQLNSDILTLNFMGYYSSNNASFIITDKKLPAIIVHHYLKDSSGEYTTKSVAPDENYTGTIDADYTTAPHIDLENLALEKDEDGNYVIPENATGKYVDGVIEITYYYEADPIELVIHHYKSGTTEKLAEDTTITTPSTVEFDEDGNYKVVCENSYVLKDNEDYNDIIEGEYTLDYVATDIKSDTTIDDTLTYNTDSEITYYYNVNYYDITTEVKDHTEYRTNKNTNNKEETTVAGGTITGQNDIVYESVESGKDQTKDEIVATPDEYYHVDTITLESTDKDGNTTSVTLYDSELTAEENAAIDEEVKVTMNEDGSATISKFENMLADKHIIVTFDTYKGRVISHYYLEGTGEEYGTEPIRVDSVNGGTVSDQKQIEYVGELYATKPSDDVENYYTYVSCSGPTNGRFTDEDINVYYYYKLNDYKYTVHYYYDNIEDESKADEFTATYGDIITEYTDKVIDHYTFEKVTPAGEGTSSNLKVTDDEDSNRINVYYIRQFKITTDVTEHDETSKDGTTTNVKGGSISGEDAPAYEIVTRGEDSTKEIDIVPDDGYEVVSVKIVSYDELDNTKEETTETLSIDDIKNEDGSVTLPEGYFENISSDKRVVVEYRKKTNVVVKYLEKGTNAVLATEETISGYETKEYTTSRKPVTFYRAAEVEAVKDGVAVQSAITYDAEGADNTQYLESDTHQMYTDTVTVTYWYERINAGIVVKHIEIDESDKKAFEDSTKSDDDKLLLGTVLDTEEYTRSDSATITTERNNYSTETAEYISTDGPVITEDGIVMVASTDDSKEVTYVDDNVIEVRYYYERQYNITTDVAEHKETNKDGEEVSVKGGTISGEDLDSYEKVNKMGSNAKEIVITPDYGYRIKSVTVNGNSLVVSDLVAEDKTITLGESYFKDVTEDKHVVVEFERIPAKVIVKYLEDGTDEPVAPEDEIDGYVKDEYSTDPKEVPGYDYEEEKAPSNGDGEMTEDDITVIYYYTRKPFNFKVEKTISKVLVNGEEADLTNNKNATVAVSYKDKDSTVVKVSYTIKVTNTEKIEGTAVVNEIVPDGYTFIEDESDLRWTLKDNVYQIETSTIKPGESVEYNVTLQWVKSVDNEGVKTNTARITDTDNDYGTEETTKDDNEDSADLSIVSEYKITTEVVPHEENRLNVTTGTRSPVMVDGGTITGQNDNPYDAVEVHKDQAKDVIVATPNKHYHVSKITLESTNKADETTETVLFDSSLTDEQNAAISAEVSVSFDENGVATISKFTDVTADKHIKVEFATVEGTVVSHYYIAGTGEEYGNDAIKVPSKDGKVVENVEQKDYIGELYTTTESENVSDIYHITSVSGEQNGEYIDGEINVYYYYELNDYKYTVHYYYDGIEDESKAEEHTATYGDEITEYTDKVIDGYIFDEATPADGDSVKLVITEDEENNRINVYYVRQYKITTDVVEHSETTKDGTSKKVKGGSISGEDEDAYELVVRGEDNTKEISIVPNSGYEIVSIKVTSEAETEGETATTDTLDIDSFKNEDGSVTLPAGYFDNIKSDKHVEVEFKKISKVIVRHLEKGTNKVLAAEDTIDGYEGEEYTTARKPITFYKSAEVDAVKDGVAVQSAITYDAEGADNTQYLESDTHTMYADTVTVTYWYEKMDAGIIVRHIEIDENDKKSFDDPSLSTDEKLALGTVLDSEEHTTIEDGSVATSRKDYSTEDKKYISADGPSISKDGITILDDDVDNMTVVYEDGKVKEIRYYYERQYEITTDVKEHTETKADGTVVTVKGGTISGEDDDPYEDVNKGGSNSKKIEIVPDDGYEVKSVTINGKTIDIDDLKDDDGKVTLDEGYFTNVDENKDVVVEFEKIPAKVIIKYVDADTGEEISPEDEDDGHVGDPYSEERKSIYDYIPADPEPDNKDGTMTKEDITVIFKYTKQFRITTDVVEHTEITKDGVVETVKGGTISGEDVNPYEIVLRGKDSTLEIVMNQSDGYRAKEIKINGTTLDFENDENIEKTKDEFGNVISVKIPTAYFTNVQEDKHITVEYERIPTRVVVKYLEDGTEKELTDETVISGHVYDEYTTEPKEIEAYRLVESKYPENDEGTMTKDEIVVKYYYSRMKFNFKVEKNIKAINVNGTDCNIENGKAESVRVAYNAKGDENKIRVTYSIKVTNNGDIEGSTIVTENIPDGFKFVAEASDSRWTLSDGKYVIKTATIGVGETVEYSVTLEWVNSVNNVGNKKNHVSLSDSDNIYRIPEETLDDNDDEAMIDIELDVIPTEEEESNFDIWSIGHKLQSPKTGDTVVIYAAMLVIGSAVLVIAIKRRK